MRLLRILITLLVGSLFALALLASVPELKEYSTQQQYLIIVVLIIISALAAVIITPLGFRIT